MITKEQADKILSYVAQEIISPLAFEERPAKEVWEELTKEKFSRLCSIVYETVDKKDLKKTENKRNEYNEDTKEAYWKYKHWGVFICSHCVQEEGHNKDKYCRNCGYKMHQSYQSLWEMEKNE